MAPIQITTRSMSDSPVIEYRIKKYFNKISKMYRKIHNCRVVIDFYQKHKHKGKMFNINLELSIPGKTLVSKKKNQNLYVAMRDVFSAMGKLLEKSMKKKIISKPMYCYPNINTFEENMMDV